MENSYSDLIAQRNEIDAKLSQIQLAEKQKAIAEIKNLIAVHRISATDLHPLRRNKDRRYAPVQPKFKDPASGNTWSGRGKTPRWLTGKDKEHFRL